MARAVDNKIDQYMTAADLATLFGFENVRSIDRLAENGIIKPTELTVRGRKVKRYDIKPTVKAYVKNLQDKAAGREQRAGEVELKAQKLRAEIALKESQGELHRLKTDIAAGRYLSVEEIKLEYSKFFVNFKKFATAIPARVAGRLAGFIEPVEVRGLEDELSKDINEQLTQFVEAARVQGTPEIKDELKRGKPGRPRKLTVKKTAVTKKTAAETKPAAKKAPSAKKAEITKRPAAVRKKTETKKTETKKAETKKTATAKKEKK